LYGTANYGGSWYQGTVFALNTNGSGFTNLHSFAFADFSPSTGGFTNSDGSHPKGGLILLGNTLYGTTFDGGSLSRGTVFALNTNGTSFINLHNFSYISDGANPYAALTLSGNTVFGTTLRVLV
jgi:uncharacterized repeat protein (TIGR03803 family)